MNQSKTAIVGSQILEKVELILGWAWVALFGLTAVMMTFEKTLGTSDKMIIWAVALIGIPILIAGKRRKKMRLEFKKYVAQLSIDPSGNMAQMADVTNTSVDVVKKNLQYMIKKGFFTNAYIDESSNRLVLPSMDQKGQNQTNPSSAGAETGTQDAVVTCNCPNCGGINKIARGTVAECDYCGSPLQG